ncbi:hypothetical protein [Fulvivirga ligni]|uniref:hypothetical protein n=1 Tax=Fulvivirga ligni TaxID=2904246 RepID=UPI001F2DB284|nr:hypothetical protein [Fulvivirga ligni]UII21243.1 hypothetical protein LVD16_25755 [Fulvivirga ligni]
MKIFQVLILIILNTSLAQAQLNNKSFQYDHSLQESDSNVLALSINSLGFAKNNEYFNDIADGYTLFGYQLNPNLSYQAGKFIRIEAGIYLQKDFGNDDYSEVAPTFSFRYNKNAFSLILGTLDGSVSHRLIEPLYDFENTLNRRLENGFQIKVDKESLFLDTWVDWQNMIYKGDSSQEQITGGMSVKWSPINKGNVKLTIPYQMVIYHQGGQIDANPEPLQTKGNFSSGLELTFPISEQGFVSEFKMQNYFVYSNNFSGDEDTALKAGSGIYLNASIQTRLNLNIMASYWRGSDFTCIQGGQLYSSQSSSYKNYDVVEPIRELLILRFMHQLKITDGVFFNTRVEPFFDFKNGTFEYAYGFYINYTGDFFLLRNR